jgi:hypothetical protein
MEKTVKTKKRLDTNDFKTVAGFLALVFLVVFGALSPDIYREYKAQKFSRQQKQCFELQKTYETAVAGFLEKNQDKLFSPGLIRESELTGQLSGQKLLAAVPACPAAGVLRIGSLDMSGAYVVSCSIHGSHDRPATIDGMIELQTAAGGKMLYSATIIRDNADVLATYLLSAGILINPDTSVRVDKLEDRIQISFKAAIDQSRLPVIRDRFIFHAEEIAEQIFNKTPVVFKLLPADGSAPVLIKSERKPDEKQTGAG